MSHSPARWIKCDFTDELCKLKYGACLRKNARTWHTQWNCLGHCFIQFAYPRYSAKPAVISQSLFYTDEFTLFKNLSFVFL